METAGAGAAFRASHAYGNYVLALLLVVGIVNFLDRQILAVLLESIKREFGFTDTQLGLLGGVAFGIFYATLGIPIARLADVYNRRNIISIAVGLWSFMTALCGTAAGFLSLFLFRVGVGVGEAGGLPPSNSLISDYFPPERRGAALAVFGMHIPLGVLVGFLVGGWLNEFFGWRVTFLAVGIPGVFLALLVGLTLREPPRGHSENLLHTGPTPSLTATIRYFWSRPACRHLPFAAALYALSAWGSGIWLPSYFIRVHGMSVGEAGTWLAFVYGLGGAAGSLLGGYLADRIAMATRDARWYMWISGAAVWVGIPFVFPVYLWSTPVPALLILVVPTLFGHMYLGPTLAMVQGLAGLRRRAVASALYYFVVNLIALGLGPLMVGMASDAFNARYGVDALRYSILAVVVVANTWAGMHFFLAGKTLREDLAAARES